MLHSRYKAEIEVIQSLDSGSFRPLPPLEIPAGDERTNLLSNPLAAYTVMRIMEHLNV